MPTFAGQAGAHPMAALLALLVISESILPPVVGGAIDNPKGWCKAVSKRTTIM